MSFLFIISGDITTLIDFASFLIWIFYGAAMVALILMRRTKKNVKRPYKVLCLIYQILKARHPGTQQFNEYGVHFHVLTEPENAQGHKL